MEYFNIDEMYEDKICFGGQDRDPEQWLEDIYYEEEEEEESEIID